MTKADHPAVVRARAKYCTRHGGCAAKTQTGIIRYALAHHKSTEKLDLDSACLARRVTMRSFADRDARPEIVIETYRKNWGSVRERPALTQDRRDSRRAQNDPKFRRRWLADLRRRAEASALFPMGSLAEITEASESRNNRMLKLSELIALAASAGAKLHYAIPKIPVGILVECDINLARRIGCKIDMTGKDASFRSTRGASELVSAPGETEWKNGKPIGYTRATRDNYVRSFAVIRDDHTLDYALHAREVQLVLPDGYMWDQDRNGLRTCLTASRGDDYHPSAGDLVAKNAVEKLIAKISENRDK